MEYPRLGAIVRDDGTSVTVFAPRASRVEFVFADGRPSVPLDADERGYHTSVVPDAPAGTRYRLRMDDGPPFPDPASRFQPDGVHGDSLVVDSRLYDWKDASWSGMPREDLVFYELHVGTFSPEGTFAGIQERLGYLRELGITAIELMPVADFPGERNWGYDCGALYAPSRAYGKADDLRRLVDLAHQMGMAVFLDVVYNHLGPDGAYVAAFAPMFTERHHTPWGAAINLDDEYSPGVRAFFIDNALHWLNEYHFDGLRLDATHALIDSSETHFLAELADAVSSMQGRPRYLVAEDPRNINTIVRPRAEGGYGIDAMWTDDFHHLIRNITAGDADGYYADYAGATMHEVAETIRRGWFFDGRRSPTTGKPRGTDPADIPVSRCVICIQNHDQVGNRPIGNRLSKDIDLPTYRAVTALLMFAPELPLLFMGQEWAASTPFQFFTDHEAKLGSLVTRGRRKEFESFLGFTGDVPDPQSRTTFDASRLRWNEVDRPPHCYMLNLYRELLTWRRRLFGHVNVSTIDDHVLAVERGGYYLVCCIARSEQIVDRKQGTIVLHTEQPEFAGDTLPPEISAEQVRFSRPGAVLLRMPPDPTVQGR